jgi:uncharacterized phage protein (TIGR01671 family)
MREILFKAKRVDGKGWVEGDYFYNFNDSMPVISQVIHDTGNFDEPPFDYQKLINVIPKTVCQFTGLVDKNGVKIFEGDNVSVNYGRYALEKQGKQRTGVVVYEDMGFVVKIDNSEVRVIRGTIHSIEIIGNIHD